LYLLYLNVIFNTQYIEKPARATKIVSSEVIEHKKKNESKMNNSAIIIH